MSDSTTAAPGSPGRIIDAQVHVYEPDHPGRPWQGRLVGPDSMTGDQMVAAMHHAGVDQALVVSSWAFYGADASYATEVQQAYPERFRTIAPINPYVDGAAEAVHDWAATPGSVGVRMMPGVIPQFDAAAPEVAAVVRAAEAHGLPICLYSPGLLHHVDELALRFPGTQFLLDHLGLPQVFAPPVPPEPFADLDTVLSLARHENLVIKVSAACTLSQRPFPFDDLWPPLESVFAAFGIDRCLWGTDWTRAVELVSYPGSVAAFRDHLPLSPSEREALMGGNVARVFGW